MKRMLRAHISAQRAAHKFFNWPRLAMFDTNQT